MLPFSNNRRYWGCGLLAVCALIPSTVYPHDPITTKLTWTQEISRIVYKRCASCHRPGGTAFSLLSYEDARPWAKAIRDQVRGRTMPPWGAVKGVGEFVNDRSLSEPEIDMIVAWVEGGAPEGDAAFLPSLPPHQTAVVPKRFTRKIPINREWKATAPVRVGAIRLQAPKQGDSLEAWIVRGNGSIERLLWVHQYHALDEKEFIFRAPVPVRPGDVIRSTGGILVETL